jgi:two-component system nitrate/nitrite response regulator NarL
VTASIFIAGSDFVPPRWLAAFPDLELRVGFEADSAVSADAVYWLDVSGFDDNDTFIACLDRLIDANASTVVLSGKPGESEAFALLSRGVRGYCHVQAAPEQLQEVARVVRSGGFWMPPELVKSLITLAKRVDRRRPSPEPGSLEALTEREQQVALLVGRGFNNREIAAALEVSERTVKANLTMIFEKLALRDRVQLALHVNRLPVQ